LEGKVIQDLQTALTKSLEENLMNTKQRDVMKIPNAKEIMANRRKLFERWSKPKQTDR